MFDEKFIDKPIGKLCKEYSLIHGSNVNYRVMPDIVDGLKVVSRRLLYIMFLKDQGKNFRKVAAITGDTIARLHMHSDDVVYKCLVGLAQWWNNSIPLIEGMGNFGSVAGDEAGAPRYIKARLSEYAHDCFFSDWKNAAVDMVLGGDAETMEPLYLPAKYPNILLNGTIGIGYGKATNFPTFNFKEIVEATIKLIKNPNSEIILIPDSPTGADIVENNFKHICDTGSGKYMMRCKYNINPETNMVQITNLPLLVYSNNIREKIADVKEKGGLSDLMSMDDLSGKGTDIRLYLRPTANPYRFMKKMITLIDGLQRSYPVSITVTQDYRSYDLPIRDTLLEWIKYRREQKRVVISYHKTRLLAEQRTNDVKLFITNEKNLKDSINIFKGSRNKQEIEKRLIERYRDSDIRMDSLQSQVLADMKMHELSIEAVEKYKTRREELFVELKKVDDILQQPNGIDDLIISELKDGIKKYGTPRKSNVVPYDITIDNKIDEVCILQISSNGTVIRKVATNVDEEPVPSDQDGFAIKVDNDSSFILIDEDGKYALIVVQEIPIDSEVLLNTYITKPLKKIVAVLPFDTNKDDLTTTLISQQGVLKRILVNNFKPSIRPCISLDKGDKLVKGINTKLDTKKDILIYTDHGYGQRFDPNSIKLTGIAAKGNFGFKLRKNDHIIGCFAINPNKNDYLLYVTARGKLRLNKIKYLPNRASKAEEMVELIPISSRDSLVAVLACNQFDKVEIYYPNNESEVIEIDTLEEMTMAMEPKKVTTKSNVGNDVVKVKII